jgi:hypothetical protein
VTIKPTQSGGVAESDVAFSCVVTPTIGLRQRCPDPLRDKGFCQAFAVKNCYR